MDYYQSDAPPKDDSGLSGAMGYNFDGQIAAPVVQALPSSASSGGSGFSSQQSLTTYTIQICVDGTPMSLDVYIAKGPY